MTALIGWLIAAVGFASGVIFSLFMQGRGLADLEDAWFASVGQGEPLRLQADSLCVHGDNAESLAVLRRLRAQLDAL